MNAVIADVLKSKLANLEWLERFGGLVVQASRPEFVTGADGVQVIKGYQVCPVACSVNAENCWEGGVHKYFEPDSSKAAIGFFTDGGGVRLRQIEGPKEMWLRFEFNLRFLCWMNTVRLGTSITAGGCQPSGRVSPYVIAQLFGPHSAVGVFAGGIEETIFKDIEVKSISELPKTPGIFEPFTFARDGVNRGLFLYPYDYFGLSISGEFMMNRNCLPEFGAEWTPTVGCLAPAGNVNWFSRKAVVFLASLPVFDSNEDALAGNLSGGGTVSPLSVGDPYWGSPSHVANADAFLRVE